MDYKIVLDSCGELTYKMKESGIYHTAVLSMLVDGDTILDDESFDRKDFLKRVAVSPECPKSSCPSPDAYMELYGGAEKRVYVVTLSAELSGSHSRPAWIYPWFRPPRSSLYQPHKCPPDPCPLILLQSRYSHSGLLSVRPFRRNATCRRLAAPEPQIHLSTHRSVPRRVLCFRLIDKLPPPLLDFLSNQQSPVQSPFQFPDVS